MIGISASELSLAHPTLLRCSQEIRLSVVEFSGSKRIFSNAGIFQHVQKDAREVLFRRPSGYGDKTRLYDTLDLQVISEQMVKADIFQDVSYRILGSEISC